LPVEFFLCCFFFAPGHILLYIASVVLFEIIILVPSDFGFALGQKLHGCDSFVIDAFTRDNGYIKILSDCKYNNLSLLEISYKMRSTFSFYQVKVRSVDQSPVILINSKEKILFVQNICFLMRYTLPFGVAHRSLFDFLTFIFDNIETIDCCKFYSFFELILLKEVGFGLSIDHCSKCGSKKDLESICKKTGHSFCKNCLTEKRLTFPYPKHWQFFDENTQLSANEENFSSHESFKQALNITHHFLKKSVQYFKNPFREYLIETFLGN
jgi:DNA repair protein RecO